MKKACKYFALFLASLGFGTANVAMGTECVVLLHGYGRGSFSMSRFNSLFLEHGYRTIPINYKSRAYDIKTIAETMVLPQIESQSQGCTKLHFVGFSMGGIITRYIIANHRPENLGRVVYIGCPHSGAEIVTSFGKYGWFRKIFGQSAMDLEGGSDFLQTIPDYADYDAGVISGNFSISPIAYLFFKERQYDGIVSLESSKIKGMKDHLVVKVSHALMPYNQRVVEEAVNFIEHGKFRGSSTDSD